MRMNGRIFEMLAAAIGRRSRRDLYHSALVVRVPEGRFVIEQAPSGRRDGSERGVVSEGAVGSRWLDRFRIFRYELRRWRGGEIPDVAEAVQSPRLLTTDVRVARRILELVPFVPTPVWGRDELDAGEMWNSNSVISWLIDRSGLSAELIRPPVGGRAPGWNAGLVVARRSTMSPRWPLPAPVLPSGASGRNRPLRSSEERVARCVESRRLTEGSPDAAACGSRESSSVKGGVS